MEAVHAELPDDMAATVLEGIADVLLIVAGAGEGDYSTRLDIRHAEDHPLTTLYEGINLMLESLESARQRSVAYQKELEEKLATIELQRVAIRELSTPIIEVWQGVLCLPVVGIVDTTRSAEMTEALLSAITEKQASWTIVDITGIQVMDTGTVDHFLKMAQAVRLLGADCIVTGVNPGIAQTIVRMGVELNGVRTLRSLRDALQLYLDSREAPEAREPARTSNAIGKSRR